MLHLKNNKAVNNLIKGGNIALQIATSRLQHTGLIRSELKTINSPPSFGPSSSWTLTYPKLTELFNKVLQFSPKEQ